jgi:multiple sugar transport system permease protein
MTAIQWQRRMASRESGRLQRIRLLRTTGTLLGIVILGIFCLFPMYWMLISSFKGPGDILSNSLLPLHPSLRNYVAVFTGQNNFGLALRNSAVIASSATVIALVVGITAAYTLAHLRFRLRPIVLTAILGASMFPGIALLTPLFQLFSGWGWIDQYQSMIIPDISFCLPLAVWILTTFFQQMPWELEQAALIDGCTDGQAFRRIILPLAAPGVFTTAILVFISAWNEYLISSAMSLTLASEPVTVAIAKFSGASQFELPFGPQMAAGVVVTIPLVILVLVFQRRIVGGLTHGGLK